jgi:hypothetical protein
MISFTMIIWTTVLSGLYAIPWTLLFLLTPSWGIRLYCIRNNEDGKRIQKMVNTKCTHYTEDNKGYGYSIGRWYIMKIGLERYDYGCKYDIWMVATDATYQRFFDVPTKVLSSTTLQMTDEEKDGIKKNDKNTTTVPLVKEISVYERFGTYYDPFYMKRQIHLRQMKPLVSQQTIIEDVLQFYNKHNRAVVYIFGERGTGKSIIGLFLAHHFEGFYCNDLRLWSPGDRLGELYNEVQPTAEKPLIIVFDEIDDCLVRIHHGIPMHQKIPIQISNKTGWNKFLDEIALGLYPFLIVMMTSNSHPKRIHALDPSYLRRGRINLSYHMTKNDAILTLDLHSQICFNNSDASLEKTSTIKKRHSYRFPSS